MENFKRFLKWYSEYVIHHYKESVVVKIENTTDFAWKMQIEFKNNTLIKFKPVNESNKKSAFNFYNILTSNTKFEATGDFTKLDFLLGKFMYFIGEQEIAIVDGDCFLGESIQKFIFELEKDAFIFLHYTGEKETVESILKSGFEFNTAFDKTTVGMQNESAFISYNHILRKPYGKYIVVICISKNVYKKYNDLIAESSDKFLKVEEVLVEKPAYEVEFYDITHTLHHKYIKGFINYANGEIVINPDFDHFYDNENFLNNIP